MSEVPSAMDEIVLPAGEVIHYNGIPFRLATNTPVWGRDENYQIAKDWTGLHQPTFVAGKAMSGSK